MGKRDAGKTESMFNLLLESMGLFFRLRAVGKDTGHVSPGGGGTWGLLHSLAIDGPQTVPQLARTRPVTRQHIQQIANEVAADGLIEFVDNPVHKRSKLLRLTPKGERAEVEMTERLRAFAGDLAKDFDVAELATAARVLNAVRAKLTGAPVAVGRLPKPE
jgi:DNA-binding MarR family transcriptional regulator